jgi:hypothetical protein
MRKALYSWGNQAFLIPQRTHGHVQKPCMVGARTVHRAIQYRRCTDSGRDIRIRRACTVATIQGSDLNVTTQSAETPDSVHRGAHWSFSTFADDGERCVFV